MSYDTEKGRMGRQAVDIVEIDLDFCRNTYGASPCTAAVGVTGTQKCFNTRCTCQDPTSYLLATGWGSKGVGVTLSSNRLIATSHFADSVISSDGHDAAESHYCEVIVGAATTIDIYIGIAALGINLLNALGSGANGYGYLSTLGVSGAAVHNGSSAAYGVAYDVGDIIGINLTGGSVSFSKNGVWQGVAFTGLTGAFYIGMSGNSGTAVGTINKGETGFAYPIPTGCSPWATKSIKTYRFSNVVLPPSSDPAFIAIPALKSVSLAPTVIDPIAGIGKRASVILTFKDFAHPDTDVDPYIAERAYDSSTRGTFWTKLLARNPYYQNRAVRHRGGYLVDGQAPDAANFQTRLYLTQQIDGPTTAGEVRITAQDPLKLLDDDRAKAPLANSGRLLTAISAVGFTATLTPTGVGDSEYPASGVMVMGNELAGFTRSGDVLTFQSRGTQGTVAEAHNAGESMQAALVYSGQSITAVLYDLLVTRAGVPAGYVDLTQWNTEADTWLGDYTIGTTITKPIGLNQLVGELARQCLFYIWWDERDQTIPLRAIRPPHNETLPTLDDTNNIIADTQSVTEKASDRKTRVWVYTGQRNPTVDLDKPYNYTDVSQAIDVAAESAVEYGDKRIAVFWSRWLLPDGDSEAEKLALRLLNRYRDNPKTYVLRIDAKDSDIWTGDVVTVTMRSVVDFTGTPVATDMQVMQVRETVPGSEYELTLQDTQFKGRYAFWAPDALGDYTAVTEADRERYAFWASDAEVMSDGTAGYQYV